MDSIFQKELLKIELTRLFDTYDEQKAKNILISCVDSSYFKKETSKKPTKPQIVIKNSSICNICESTEFYTTNAEEICRSCGNLHRVVYNSTSYNVKDDRQFVKYGENKLNTIIDGKRVTLDIDKINLYTMEALTPHQRMYKSGIESIRSKLEESNIIPTESQISSISAMYWNITLYYDKYPNVKPSIKPADNKRIYQALCVYYTLDINVYIIIEAFDITLKNLEYFNGILKVIFKNTDYQPILNKTIMSEIELALPNRDLSIKTDQLLNKLIEAKLFKEISKEAYASVALYVSRDIMKKSYTTKKIQEELEITNVSKLNQNYNKVTNFIKQRPRVLL